MPLYEYRCEACGKRFEVIRKFSDPPLDACTQCGAGPVQRLVSSPAIQFKGSGWYITDYSDKGKAATTAETKKDEAKTPAADAGAGKSSSTDTAAAPAKPDAPAAKTAKAASPD